MNFSFIADGTAITNPSMEAMARPRHESGAAV